MAFPVQPPSHWLTFTISRTSTKSSLGDCTKSSLYVHNTVFVLGIIGSLKGPGSKALVILIVEIVAKDKAPSLVT